MEGFKVRCQTCGTVLYETTDRYTCHKPLTGDMLRLLPLYKDWPCYDGALAVSSTPRFLMFCSQCAGYISTTGKLMFVDFPDVRVTEVSSERSEMSWENYIMVRPTLEPMEVPVLGPMEVPQLDLMTPKDLMKELDKQSRSE